MTAADFLRMALSLDGVDEYSHAGLSALRAGGRKFADHTLAWLLPVMFGVMIKQC